jgi:hypothetical protein
MSAGRTVNSQSQEWGTPQIYVEAVKKVFGGKIDLDPCSNNYSIVNATTEYFLPVQDGLKESWNFQTIYVNPPYGADRKRKTTIKNWLAKCCKTNNEYNSEIIALVPVATNTSHWKRYVFGKAKAICFLYDTKLKFLVNGNGGGKGAPMSCAMIYWGNNIDNFRNVFLEYGAVVDISDLINNNIGSKIINQSKLVLF